MTTKPKTTVTSEGLVTVLPHSSPPLPDAKITEPRENLAAPGEREEIREVTHRVMGSRQSQRKPERSRSHRQPKRGHGSQKRKTGD